MNFLQQAYKGKNDWWRYFIGILLIFFGWQVIGIIPIVLVGIMHASDINAFQRAAVDNFMSLGINANLYLFSMIMMFAIGLLFIFLTVKQIHKRSITSLLTSRKHLDWKRVFFAFAVWLVIALGILAVDYFSNPDAFIWNFKLVPFIVLVLISLFLLPLQTSFEEILFRGYFIQALGILARNKWLPLLVTSVAFGLLHAFNPEVEKLGNMIFIYYIATGFLFGITTLMDEGLELSLGMHAANNIVAAIFVTTNWTVFQTDALFIDTSEPSLGMEIFVPVFVVYPLILLLFSKKYAWKNWKQKLFGKIEKPVIPQEDISLLSTPQD